MFGVVLLFLASTSNIIVPYVSASGSVAEEGDDIQVDGNVQGDKGSVPIDMNFVGTKEKLSNGMLDIPISFQKKITLYGWIMEALDQYVAETGLEDDFICNLEKDILYGDREFNVVEEQGVWRAFHEQEPWVNYQYEYSIQNEAAFDMRQDSYKLELQGKENILYMDINVKEGKVIIYPKETETYGGLIFSTGGNAAAYELIEEDEDGQIIFYPDFYVQSDWDDLEGVDDHFAGVSRGELEELSYLIIPESDSTAWYANVYLSVASILKRYVEENKIDDVFYFDADEDIISGVTNMIFTCRLRGSTMTLYIDIDGYNFKAHVYQMEE